MAIVDAILLIFGAVMLLRVWGLQDDARIRQRRTKESILRLDAEIRKLRKQVQKLETKA